MPNFFEVINQLRERRRAIREAISKSQASLEALDRVIEALETAAQDLSQEQLATLTVPLPSLVVPFQSETSERTRSRGELPPAEIAAEVRRLLVETGRPMKRGEVAKQLLARGVPLAGKDKNKNVGTILWRHSNEFVHLDNLGYWPKDLPLPGVYDPEKEASES